jgi:hypothetical protein
LRRQRPQKLLELIAEAELKQAVGFVKHQRCKMLEANRLCVPEMVNYATGGANDHLWVGAERSCLRAEGEAADNESDAGVSVDAEALGHPVRLDGELAGWREHKSTRGGNALGAIEQALEDREHESGSFAGAGDGAAEDVAAGESKGDDGGLDRGGVVVAEAAAGAKERSREVEVKKGGSALRLVAQAGPGAAAVRRLLAARLGFGGPLLEVEVLLRGQRGGGALAHCRDLAVGGGGAFAAALGVRS